METTGFPSSRDKILNGTYVQNLFDALLLSGPLAIIKAPGHFKSDSLEAKGNHLADVSAKTPLLLDPKTKPLSWSRKLPPLVTTQEIELG